MMNLHLNIENRFKNTKHFHRNFFFEDFVNLRQPLDATDRVLSSNNVEVGLDYVEFQPINVDFSDSRVVAIYGKKEFGKTNLLRLLLQNLKNNKKNSRFVFFLMTAESN